MYRSVPRGQIADTLAHLRDLFRGVKPSNDQEYRAHERREVATRNLLSNLFRTKEHPTLHSVLEVADIFSLTLDGAHRLFGYNLESIRDYDLWLNGGRTHIIESYPFERDMLIDLPSELGSSEVFASNATLRNLVSEWQTDIPIRTLEEEGWQQPRAFYVHVGTEDSLGSSLPPGAVALVEPIRDEEKLRPNPRAIYLLQFGNGYRRSRCVVTRGKLLLLVSGRNYTGPQEFAYPGGVRIAGRIRMFALELPLLHVVAWPDSPNTIGGISSASNVHKVVLADETQQMLIQPLSNEPEAVTFDGALRSVTYNKAIDTFSMEDVSKVRGANKGEFFVVVVGDTHNKFFKVKQKMFSRLFQLWIGDCRAAYNLSQGIPDHSPFR